MRPIAVPPQRDINSELSVSSLFTFTLRRWEKKLVRSGCQLTRSHGDGIRTASGADAHFVDQWVSENIDNVSIYIREFRVLLQEEMGSKDGEQTSVQSEE
jgi:hypothetical protein